VFPQTLSINCPKCRTVIPLSETLARPFLDAERSKLRQEQEEQSAALKCREEELANRRDALEKLEKQLRQRQQSIATAVEEKLQEERESVIKAAEKKTAASFESRLKATEQELSEKTKRLAEAEQAELAIRRDRKSLEDEKRRLELEIERRIHGERQRIRELTMKEEEENHRLKLAERDKIIADMQRQIEDLRRRVDQGSQQLQGEVQELEIESVLQVEFPTDQVVPVQKGRAGGDVLQKVVGPRGVECGTILWESKRTRNWSKEWLEKNRKDQRSSGSQIGVIVTRAMPPGVAAFDRIDGVWITSLCCMLPLAKALRLVLIEAALTKSVAHGRNGKTQHLYEYIAGSQYKSRVAAIAEACIAMQQDDEAEKRVLSKYWAKRQRRVELLLNETVSMWGELQAIVGRGMPELPGLMLPTGGDGLDPATETNNDDVSRSRR
jgi:hypothetical protein